MDDMNDRPPYWHIVGYENLSTANKMKADRAYEEAMAWYEARYKLAKSISEKCVLKDKDSKAYIRGFRKTGDLTSELGAIDAWFDFFVDSTYYPLEG